MNRQILPIRDVERTPIQVRRPKRRQLGDDGLFPVATHENRRMRPPEIRAFRSSRRAAQAAAFKIRGQPRCGVTLQHSCADDVDLEKPVPRL